MSFCKGLLLGAALGAVLAAVLSPKKPCKNRSAARILRTIGNVIDGVGGVFGQ